MKNLKLTTFNNEYQAPLRICIETKDGRTISSMEAGLQASYIQNTEYEIFREIRMVYV